jgi:hypothetical protein
VAKCRNDFRLNDESFGEEGSENDFDFDLKGLCKIMEGVVGNLSLELELDQEKKLPVFVGREFVSGAVGGDYVMVVTLR